MAVADLDLTSLSCVEALAQTLRFSAAARSQHLSPAAFSKRIAQAEAAVGVPLFVRTTRTVALTEAGATVVPAIRDLLQQARALPALVSDAPAPTSLVVGTRHELGISWLMPVRAALRERAPWLTLHLRFGSADDLERELLTLGVDAVITSRPPTSTRIESAPLHQEDYVLVGAPALLRRRALRTSTDARAHTLLDADDTLPLARYLPQHQRWRFADVVTLGTIEAIRLAAEAGEGVAVLPRYHVVDALCARRLRAVRLPEGALAHDWFRLLWRAREPRQAALRVLMEACRAQPLR